MNKLKLSITIGIPAFNEEKNIKQLIQSLISQKCRLITIEHIYVLSDGSTDNTDGIIEQIKDAKVKLITNVARRGLAYSENKIIKKTSSHILVLLNADTIINDVYFIEKLCKPIIQDQYDLVAAKLVAIPGKTFFEKLFKFASDFKYKLYENTNNGENIYTCNGVARAYSKKLYKSIVFPFSIGEDAFSYLYCKINSFKYFYNKSAAIQYKMPGSFFDQSQQSIRFVQSKAKMEEIFGKSITEPAYNISYLTIFRITLSQLFKKPFYMIGYIIVILTLRIKSLFAKEIPDLWIVAKTTKI